MNSNTPDTETVTAETKRLPGGQVKTFEPKERERVQFLAGRCMPQSQIAEFIGCDPKTLRKHFRKELKLGAAMANETVLDSLYTMATSKRNSACAIFWAKTRCKFRQNAPPKPPVSTRKTAAPHTPRSLEDFTVHLNDGAPNGDF